MSNLKRLPHLSPVRHRWLKDSKPAQRTPHHSRPSSYIVDTNTAPLNQRYEPSVGGAQAGSFDPGQTGLVFTGECVVNVTDGYTWWKIFNGTEDVWVASAFVTPN